MRTQRDKQVKITECSVDDLCAGIGNLAEELWLEVEGDSRFDLSIDWSTYHELESDHELVVLIATRDWAIVGFSVTVLYNPIHSDTVLVGVNSALFLQKEYRGGGLGSRLILATESAVRRQGAKMMSWRAKPGTSMAHVMDKAGYDVDYTTYSRSI